MEQKQWGRERVIHSSEEVTIPRWRKGSSPKIVWGRDVPWDAVKYLHGFQLLLGTPRESIPCHAHAQMGTVLVSEGNKTFLTQIAWALWWTSCQSYYRYLRLAVLFEETLCFDSEFPKSFYRQVRGRLKAVGVFLGVGREGSAVGIEFCQNPWRLSKVFIRFDRRIPHRVGTGKALKCGMWQNMADF